MLFKLIQSSLLKRYMNPRSRGGTLDSATWGEREWERGKTGWEEKRREEKKRIEDNACEVLHPLSLPFHHCRKPTVLLSWCGRRSGRDQCSALHGLWPLRENTCLERGEEEEEWRGRWRGEEGEMEGRRKRGARREDYRRDETKRRKEEKKRRGEEKVEKRREEYRRREVKEAMTWGMRNEAMRKEKKKRK
jgi:hypothetical protein